MVHIAVANESAVCLFFISASNVFILAALYTERRLAVVSSYKDLHTFS